VAAAPSTRAPAPHFLSPLAFERRGYPWADWARLRREEPVAWIDAEDHQPFWAVTRHADVVRVSRDPGAFRSAPGNILPPRALSERVRLPLAATLRASFRTGVVFRPRVMGVIVQAALAARRAGGAEGAFKNLLNLDPPEHRAFRQILAGRFTARALHGLEARVEQLAHEVVARVAARAADPALAGEPFDFVTELAARFPLAVIMELLGCPAEDHERVLRWSNAIVGAFDEEYGDSASPFDAIEEARLGLFDYFARQVRRRRRAPGGDLVSALVAARAGGRALTDFEVLSYCFLLALAGNETTRNAASGGMLALLERPEQLRRLRAEPALLATAPDEIVRWTSPIVYFRRTAACEVELGGRRIRPGDRLALFYPSANRDEDVFPDAEAFDLARSPNRHLGFGIGEHFCLGAHLARMELRALFAAIARSLPEVEPAGPVVRLRSNFVGGIKHLPLRFAHKEPTCAAPSRSPSP
jgi:cytochrome P450